MEVGYKRQNTDMLSLSNMPIPKHTPLQSIENITEKILESE